MHYPTKREFKKLSRKGNLIPVYREIVADMETPVSAYKKIESDTSFLLESVEGGENVARYSFLGSDPILTISAKMQRIEISEAGKKRALTGDPLEALKGLLKRYKPVRNPSLPGFHGGFVGFMGYDMVRFIENIPDRSKADKDIPDMCFVLTDTILAFDHAKRKIIVISNAFVDGDADKAYDAALIKIDRLVRRIRKPLKPKEFDLELVAKPAKLALRPNMTRAKFISMVNRAKEYIRAGDIIQAVLSQRFNFALKANPFNVYRVLRTINPSPYMFYLKFGSLKLIGSSPEVMVRLEGGIATVRPIAGTRPRGKDEKEDRALEDDLLKDRKERAEHIMLVDLGRNDLGRVCKFGSVKTTELFAIERYSHVMHIVSNVQGEIAPGRDAFDLIKASFPAGTVSGAPKVRAMQIIDELESGRRGPYAGSVGYFSFSGDLDSCITIRTIVVNGSAAYVQAGAGIVADSVGGREYQETVNKAKALIKAVELAGR